MNSSLRSSVSLCIGVPGLLLWAGGLLWAIVGAASAGHDAAYWSPGSPSKIHTSLALGAGACLTGYAISVFATIIRDGGVTRQRLLKLIGIELLVQVMALLSVFGFFAFRFARERELMAAWAYGAAFPVALAGLFIVARMLSKVPPSERLLSGRIFQDEVPASFQLRKAYPSARGPQPRHRVLLLQLFLGVPGTLLELAGGIVMAAVGPVVAGDWQQSLHMPALILAGGFGAFVIGHLMTVMQQLLADAPRYRMEGRLIPYFVGLEIGAHFLAILALSLFFICVGVERSDPARKALVFGLAAVAVAWLTGEAFDRLGQIRKKWQGEFEKVGRQVPG